MRLVKKKKIKNRDEILNFSFVFFFAISKGSARIVHVTAIKITRNSWKDVSN